MNTTVTKNAKGLMLLELIMTIVLIGIIATFTGFFIYSGVNGYLRAEEITNGSLDAQRALDRISLELRDINAIVPTPNATSVTYTSEILTGTRTLRYDGNLDTIYIRVATDDYVLLENVESFNLAYKDDLNLDNNNLPAVNEVAYIDVVFKLEDIGRDFKTRIFPRNLVPKTW